MATDEPENPLTEQLDPEKQQQLVDLVENGDIDAVAESTGLPRRQVILSGLALLAGISAGGYSASQIIEEVSAAASTTDSDGNVGLPGDRVDVFGETVDSNSVTTNAVANDDYNETVQSLSGSGTKDINLSQGNLVSIAATGNVTITFSGVSSSPAGNSLLVYFYDSDGGGSYSISWPSSVVWDGSNAVTSIPASSDVEVALVSYDGGSEWRGREGGKDFA